MLEFSFSDEDMDKASALIRSHGCKNILFSEGTYQVEIHDGTEVFWPFLQMSDEGRLLDSFCTCPGAEKKGKCAHLAASAMQIFHDHTQPLHLRFRDSFWNKLCSIASRRHGYDTSCLVKKDANSWVCKSNSSSPLFFIQTLGEKGLAIFHELIRDRAIETEETSLKFSNLSKEELELWRSGTPSPKLQYELSFWADLAKWMMLKQDNGESYKIDFIVNDKSLPKGVTITFGELRFGFYIAEVNWPEIILSLRYVKSTISVYEFQDVIIHKILYDESNKSLLIDSTKVPFLREKIEKIPPDDLINVGSWIFHSEVGFFAEHIDPIFQLREIETPKVGGFLEKYPKIVRRFLQGTVLHQKILKVSYSLNIDSKNQLHLHCFVFNPGDLYEEGSVFFGPWAYIKNRGFYRLEGLFYNEVHTIIAQSDVGRFVENHQLFLSDYEGFQTHTPNVESHVIAHLDESDSLLFEVESQFFDDRSGDVIDFGDWIYLKERGFYHKLSGTGLTSLSPGLIVEKERISSFIHAHKEELEQIRNFFALNSPITSGGVHIYINEDNLIVVDPKYIFSPKYSEGQVKFFGDFVYVKNEGFSKIPVQSSIPLAYPKKTIIAKKSEAYFITVELEKLKPFIIKLDSKLKVPKSLVINVEKIWKGEDNSLQLNLSYVSELGSESVATFYENIQENNSYALTSAGLILFKDPRFNWLRTLSDKAVCLDDQSLTLTTLDWIRLSLFEEVNEPTGNDPVSVSTRQLFEELQSFQTREKLSLRNFQSTLRPYQKVGVEWLWFLYCHGLSGILCDDMGLGKTHQAMELLAAVKNSLKSKRRKFIIICPTSVIYHWEDLLKKFLPKAKVHIFYGTQRSLSSFRRDAEILLTTYGTMRSEKEALSKYHFEVAIYDELQFAKNIHSQTHKALNMLKTKTRIGLSGTPIENNLYDLKALFDVILPSYFPPTSIYREVFVNPIEKHQDQEKKQYLSKIIHPFILRRKKHDVLDDLPEKTEEISKCDLSLEQKKLYRSTYLQKNEAILQEIQSEKGPAPVIHVFALLNQLKQICNHPALLLKDVENYKAHKSGKWDLFLELLQETRDSGQKMVVFSQYLGMLTIIEKHLESESIGYAAIRGSTINRKGELERFRDDPSCEVFVASLKAVGVGVDLVAASVVVHYDRWWNPAKENQATDRVHRIGQNRGVQVFKLVTNGSIEEHIHRLIEKKIGLAEGIIGYDDQEQIKKLNRNEILDLFKKINKDLQNM